MSKIKILMISAIKFTINTNTNIYLGFKNIHHSNKNNDSENYNEKKTAKVKAELKRNLICIYT